MKLENLKPKNIAENLKNESEEMVSAINQNKKPFLFIVILAVILMFVICWITFFATVRGSEQVLVPNVEGKELATALLELQEKELYPKIQLKYTDNPDDAGKILNQNPESGSIVKAGRRVSLTVSRGMILDHVENYIGQNYDDIKINLQTMFTGSSRPLIVLDEPSYKSDPSPSGTVLAQEPPEGTVISSPITVKLIVSRGSNFENTRVPDIKGLDFSGLLQVISSSKIIFDFTAHIADNSEQEGIVTSQQEISGQYVPNYSHVSAEISLPKKQKDNEMLGLFVAQLPSYPYAVEMILESSKDGVRDTVVTLRHTGGSVSIPYIAQKDSELILSVAGKTVARQMVE